MFGRTKERKRERMVKWRTVSKKILDRHYSSESVMLCYCVDKIQDDAIYWYWTYVAIIMMWWCRHTCIYTATKNSLPIVIITLYNLKMCSLIIVFMRLRRVRRCCVCYVLCIFLFSFREHVLESFRVTVMKLMNGTGCCCIFFFFAFWMHAWEAFLWMRQ